MSSPLNSAGTVAAPTRALTRATSRARRTSPTPRPSCGRSTWAGCRSSDTRWGGVTAFQLASRETGLVGALIVEEGGADNRRPCVPHPVLDVRAWPRRAPTLAALGERVRERGIPDAGYFLERAVEYPDGWGFLFDLDAMMASQRAAVGDWWRDWLGSTCPALLVHGGRSFVLPAELAREMADLRPGTLHTFPDCGHGCTTTIRPASPASSAPSSTRCPRRRGPAERALSHPLPTLKACAQASRRSAPGHARGERRGHLGSRPAVRPQGVRLPGAGRAQPGRVRRGRRRCDGRDQTVARQPGGTGRRRPPRGHHPWLITPSPAERAAHAPRAGWALPRAGTVGHEAVADVRGRDRGQATAALESADVLALTVGLAGAWSRPATPLGRGAPDGARRAPAGPDPRTPSGAPP